ncbi:MAG: malto-oligosyltrehalose synthase [Ilumatobacteraceae bacterium]
MRVVPGNPDQPGPSVDGGIAQIGSNGGTDLRATYRLQLSADFRFDDAAAAVPYLHDLGVSHLYLSPVLTSTPGSTHGYDVCDAHRIDDALGGEGGFRALVDRAHEYGMGLVVDIAPNHMAMHHTNDHWFDVLRFGTASRHANWFDIDWSPGHGSADGCVLLPILGDHYDVVVDSGDLRVERRGHDVVIRYGERIFPLSIPSTGRLIASAARAVTEQGTEPDPQIARGTSILFALGDSPAAHLEAERTLTVLADACERDTAFAAALDAELARVNGDRDELHRLLEEQHYRLARWTTLPDDLDDRRCTDVADLIGVRTEDPTVFESIHSRIAELIGSGAVDGIRVDHLDGLADPTDYTERLRAIAPHAWIVVDKILVGDEELIDDWPVHGTTGYETAALIDRLWVDADAEGSMTEAMTAYTGETDDWSTVRRSAKQQVVDEIVVGEVRRLAADLGTIVAASPDRLDVPSDALAAVVGAFAVEMPVYRTYVRPGRPAEDRDVRIVARAAAAVRAHRSDIEPALVDLVVRTMVAGADDEVSQRFVRRFQQLSGHVMAKGVEDTAFYRYPRLVSLNEVGSDPGAFGVTLDEFHQRQSSASTRHPRRMVTASTHDTTRSADVRARITALSEVPDRWRETIEAIGERLDELVGEHAHDPVLDILVVQTLIGATPISVDRATAYARTAAREAKRATSWLHPDESAEAQLDRVVGHLIGDARCVELLDGLGTEIATAGVANMLASTLITLTVPGVPDLYQGAELATFDLDDPDNRRPVDLTLRRETLVDSAAAPDKFRLVRACLALRRDHVECFVGPRASYSARFASGAAADQVVAFGRGEHVVVVATRLPIRRAVDGGWRDTALTLPDGTWEDVLTTMTHHDAVPIGELVGSGSVALLIRR